MDGPNLKRNFVAVLRPTAAAVERETGIKADLGITQAAHESAWGSSRLAVEAKNLFGITAEPGTYWRTQGRAYVNVITTEYRDGRAYQVQRPFRKYDSWGASYQDWARLMRTPHYQEAYAFAVAGDFRAFASALQRAGYATDPRYSAKLERVYQEVLS